MRSWQGVRASRSAPRIVRLALENDGLKHRSDELVLGYSRGGGGDVDSEFLSIQRAKSGSGACPRRLRMRTVSRSIIIHFQWFESHEKSLRRMKISAFAGSSRPSVLWATP